MRKSLRATLALTALALVIPLTTGASSGAAEPNGPWRKQEPIPTPYHFHDVDMIAPSEGWAVAAPGTGDHGYIFHTTSAGKKWKQQGPAFRQLLGIGFFDALRGVAVGNEFRYTTDGGQTWLQGTGVLGSQYDVDMVTTSVAYSAGFGAVSKTTDGGRTWVKQPLPLNGNLVGIDFVDANRGWVVGAEGSVYRTTNGGASWVRQRRDAGKFYTGVSFVSATEGWVSGNADILHTTDGGTTWTPQLIPSGADAIEVRFIDPLNGYAAGALRTILHTTNGGQTWTLQLGGVYEEPNNRYPFDALDVASPTVAVAMGGGNSIYTTSNAGETWLSRGSGSPTLPFRFARTDATHLWSANSNSEVLYTTNGGRKWERSIIQVQIDCDRCSNTADIAFLNDQEGWAVINGLFTTRSWVWHSADGGRSWLSLDVTNTGPLTGIAIVDAQTLVAVSGIDDLIFRSTDGGETWSAVPHPRGGTWFGSVRFLPGTLTGYAVGEGGKILKSVDGGASWTLQRNANHLRNLIDVSFADVNNGWTVGGEELHTSDGGQTWVKQDAGVFGSVSVYAVSPTTAWVGGIGELARTLDGGQTWTVETPSQTDWFALTFLNADDGWAGGQDLEADDVPGSIWRRTGPGVAPAEGERPESSHFWKAPPSSGREADLSVTDSSLAAWGE